MFFYSFRNRLIALFVLLLVVAFGAMAYMLFDQSRAIIRSYIESSALEKMDEYASFIDMATTQIYDLSSLVFNSDAVQTWDHIMSDPAAGETDKVLANLAVSQFLTRATNSYSSLSSVSLYRKEGVWVSSDNQVVADGTFRQDRWFTDLVGKGEHWTSAHRDRVEASRSKPYQVVSLAMPIGTFDPVTSKAVMKVNVSAEFLLEPLNRIHLGDKGTIYLLDNEGKPMLGQAYGVTEEGIAIMERIRSSRSPQGVEYLDNADGSSDIIVYKKLKKNNWLLVGFVPEGDLFAKLHKLRTSILLFASLLLIGAIVTASWLSYGITKPLSMLASAMRFVQRGDFAAAEARIPPRTIVRNEIGFVTSTFRNMVVQLRQHIKTEFELKLLRQQAEYKALLMQINPHFLFNTLELLSSLTLQKRTDDAVRVIESLGKMLRFSLKISDDIVAVEEEIKYLRYYVTILQTRFGDKLDIDIERDGDLQRLRVVKFLLQPLVENAVKYSFQARSIAVIRIGVRREAEQLVFTVADNGPGMDETAVNKLAAEAGGGNGMESILISANRQIGLRNVLARGKIYYGARFSFSIDTAPGQGTRIELRLPIQEGSQDVPLSGIDR
ncbi:sensor histidine kinase [Paenibacillus chartarius]|uniref:Sensor histidine kinase n=1 Tax=Paenibacillus chartarius TaxID=747481 RepID=A0ABV6DSJ2_9BACL